MNPQRVVRTMLVCIGLHMISVHGQNSQSFRIPSDGDSCVVNINCGRGGETTQQARGPQGHPGKRGSPGLPGLKGDTGLKGEVGPRGIATDISTSDVTSAVMKALNNPKDCKRVFRLNAIVLNATGGVFDIYPESEGESVSVYCDLGTDGGGWTVFQRRMDGSVDFYRGWDDYVNGFGEKDKEFWLGLETIHQLTKDGNYELRVDLTDWNGDTAYAKYGSFSVASRDHNYRLNVGTYSGTAGDSLIVRNNNMEFTTSDADHDISGGNCAEYRKGAWWYTNCGYSSLNGRYRQGRFWYHWKHDSNRLRFSEMKFRKKE